MSTEMTGTQDMGENPNAAHMEVKRKLPPQTKTKGCKKNKDVKYRKALQAPKRFKSAYMFFSTAMHPLLRKRLAEKGVTEKVHSNQPMTQEMEMLSLLNPLPNS
jgi:hypothetical protein